MMTKWGCDEGRKMTLQFGWLKNFQNKMENGGRVFTQKEQGMQRP